MLRAYGHIAVGDFADAAGPGLSAGRIVRRAGQGASLAHRLPACLMTPATAVVYCNSALLVGLKRALAGFFADTIFRPLLIVFCFALAAMAGNAEAKIAELIWLAIGFAAS